MSSVSPLPGVEGLDVSAYQADEHHVTRVRWPEVYAAGRRWMLARATVGTARDLSYPSHVHSARAAGLLVGGYHAAAPQGDPVKQAQAFVAALGVVDLPPVLDLETGLFSATNPIGLQPEVIRQWAETWIAEVQSAMGRQVKLYGYPSYLAALAVPTGSLLAQCELIIAHYGPRKPTIPAPWKRAIAWQYLADPSPPTNTPAGQIDGYDPPKGFGVDCDVFLGTEDELRSWWARSAIADERVPDTLPEGIALDTPGPHTKPHEMPTTSQLINAAFGRGSAT